MIASCHPQMRTTLTIDDDVRFKLKAEMRRSGATLKETVNRLLRPGLLTPGGSKRRQFRVQARDLGRLRAGLNLDSVSDAIEQLEGSIYR